MLNHQPVEKLDRQDDGTLDVHSIFYTIQGEGPHVGRPSIFVRLAGCNLQCPGCDTEYTVGTKEHPRQRYSLLKLRDEVFALSEEEVAHARKPLVVITGGEPFRQNLTPFANLMVRMGFDVQIETNGTLAAPIELDGDVDIVCSPKTGKMNPELEKRVTALKYVVKAGQIDRKDGLPIRALDHTCSPTVAKPPAHFRGTVYVQAMDEGNAHANRRNLEAAKDSCMKYGHTLGVQVHKTIGVE